MHAGSHCCGPHYLAFSIPMDAAALASRMNRFQVRTLLLRLIAVHSSEKPRADSGVGA